MNLKCTTNVEQPTESSDIVAQKNSYPRHCIATNQMIFFKS